MKFAGDVVLVTGGNSGIGLGIVERFLAEGARVIFVGRNSEKGLRVQAEMRARGGDETFLGCDLSDENAVKDLFVQVQDFGRLDVVVNNAGVGARRSGIADEDNPGVRWNKMR